MAGTVIEQITECLQQKKNFVLSGGAGSGKTYTLMQTLNSVYQADASVRVACITYTNVAADEIKKRSPYSNLWVSTIHDFLWDNIKGFQKNLKVAVLALIEAEKAVPKSGLSYSGEILIDENTFTFVEYKNYRKLEEGTISHDDLLKVAEYMYSHYPLLSKILCDKYSYIFVDEYQDTQRPVINILLNHIKGKASGRLCLGFFGDKMQSIYETGVVDIQSYVVDGSVTEIKKSDNYRCSERVIDLLNKIRSDLKQEPAKKNEDGTIANKTGSITFMYSQNDFDLAEFQKMSIASQWNFNDPSKTKLLFLTHRLIATRTGWDGILAAYSNNDMLLGDEPDRLASHLLKIGGILHAYVHKDYASVIGAIELRVKTINDKHEISRFLVQISTDTNATIDSAIESFNNERLLRKDDRLDEYIENHSERYDAIKNLPLSQVLAYFEYYNDFSPYSTQHGIKGAEFDDVLVVMDNGRWNNYNFKYYFEGTSGKESVIKRTERIFYVCCSRAMNSLVIYYPKPTAAVLVRAKQLFGEENIMMV